MKQKQIFLAFFILLSLLTMISCGKKTDSVKGKALYYCPMHTQVTSDKPGSCPICQMDLVKKIDGDSLSSKDLKNILSLNENARIMANVATIKVIKGELVKSIKLFGTFDFAENGKKTISAKFGGRIERLLADKTGDYVSVGTPLYEIYSPAIFSAQNDLISLLKGENFSAENKDKLLNSARNKLLLAGLTQNQVSNIEQTNEASQFITYYSPANGTIIEKNVQEGMYVNEGTAVYQVADLSIVWGIAEVFQQDLTEISLGDIIAAKVEAYPNELFTGTISLIYPVLNSEAGTVKIRVTFANPGQKLKPSMYFTAEQKKNTGFGIIIPENAVIRTGERDIVWLKSGEGMFELRRVKLGVKLAGSYQVIEGVNEGDLIAYNGGFLLDSEARLQKKGIYSDSKTGDTENNSKPSQPSSNEKSTQTTTEKNDTHNHADEGIDIASIDKNMDGKVFECPMDWDVLTDIAGKCTKCKMKLKEYSIADAKKNLLENNYKVK